MAFGDPRVMPGRYAPVGVFDTGKDLSGHIDCSIAALVEGEPAPELIVVIHSCEWLGRGPDPPAPEGRFWLIFPTGFALGGTFTPGLQSFIAHEVRGQS